jgi:tRNA-specific 2-thiouridylase
VRKLAEAHDFLNAKKHDSQDICFVPDGDYAAFIERHTGRAYPPGDFLDEAGNVLGQHRGVIRYTIGQRRGLGLSFPEPMYVKAVNVKENTVTLAPERGLYSRGLIAGDVNLISVAHISAPMHLKAKVRYRQAEQPAMVEQLPDGRLHVEFDEPQRAITCGQALVLYDGDTVVGGGTIEEKL